MIRSRLHYHRPQTLGDTSALLAEHAGNVAVLGGGTQLLPQLNRNEISVGHLVDLRGLKLNTIAIEGEKAVVGAMVTYADVLDCGALAAVAPLLPRVAKGITGGRQITQQATLVGSACQNIPSSDMPGVLVALQARLRVHGVSGEREIAARDFFKSARAVDLRPGEFVVSFTVGKATHVGYCKVKHCTGSWPIATASAVRDRASGTTAITLGAVEAVPLRIEVSEPHELQAQIRQAVVNPWSDVLAPGSYRAAIAAVVARRALSDLQGATS